MSAFIVHGVPGSPYVRSVLVALEEKGAAYRLQPLGAGGTKSPEHLLRHPFGRIPVVEHGDYALYEAQAILRYLDRILPSPPLTPADPKVAGRMDQVMGINDWYLFQGVGNVIGFHRIVSPRLSGGTPDEAAIAAAMPKAKVVFDEIARLLGDRDYLVGDAFTLADILVAPQMAFLVQTPEWARLTADHPNLAAWIERIEARASFRATTWEAVAAIAKAA